MKAGFVFVTKSILEAGKTEENDRMRAKNAKNACFCSLFLFITTVLMSIYSITHGANIIVCKVER